MSVTLSHLQPQTSIPGLYPKRGKARKMGRFEGPLQIANLRYFLGLMEAFAFSALAPAVAVLFTNPFDTAKVRLQLQGQLPTGSSEIRYKNSFDALNKIFRNEGVKGLVPAIMREGSKNVFRIGMFDPIMNAIHDSKKKGRAPGYKRVFAGSLCGLQSASSGLNAVGHQHGYTGVFSGLSAILKTEGIKGLYRGALLSVGRSIVGSGANLATFSILKEHLLIERKWSDGWKADSVSGLTSGMVSVIFMNPIDVVRTRFYNQPTSKGVGSYYSSGLDAFHKIMQKEGVKAFYKGFFSHFLRIGPHFCFTFLFLGILRRRTEYAYLYLDRKDAFNNYDSNHDGKLDQTEVEFALSRIFESLGENEPDSKSRSKYAASILSECKDDVVTFDDFPVMEKSVREMYKRLSGDEAL